MKFKKLQIHNIASIEDATIEFDQQPLSDSDVFLITGKTGSGKSTILDAICLAIYGDTPRLYNTQMKGDTTDAGESVKVDDVRQLLRRNTGEASVTLSFVGNNGIEYESTWSIARARNKVEGRLQSVKRSLKRLSDETTYTKKQDIEPEIAAAVGLDFNQFCRTTMLAQGQFTQFLNSDDKDKAAILEKITGVDAYTKIGKKVFEVTRKKKQDWDSAQQIVEGFNKVLSDEEIESRKQEKKLLTDKQNELNTQRKVLEGKQTWMNKSAELAAQVKQSQEAFDKAKMQWETKEVDEKRQLVARWNETVEVRNSINEASRSAKEAETAKDELNTKKNDFAVCIYAKSKAESTLTTDKQTLAEILSKIEAGKDKDKAIEQSQAIMGHVNDIAQDQKTIVKHQTSIEELTANVKKLEEELKTNQATEANKNEAFAQKQATLQEAETKANSIPMAKLREESEALNKRLNNIALAHERLQTLTNAQQHIADEKEAIADLEKKIADLNKEIATKKPEVDKALALVEERKRALEQQVATVDEWAKKIRGSLKEGDLCPVCQQHVVSVPQETVLDELYAQAEKDCKDAEAAHKTLADALIGLQNDLKVATQLHDKRANTLVNDKSLAKAQEAVKAIFTTLEMELSEDANAQLDALENKLTEAVEANKSALKDGEDAEKQVKLARKELDKARTDCDNAKKSCDDTQKKIDTEAANIKTTRELMDQKIKDIAAAEDALDKILEDSGVWANDWHKDGAAFVSELETLVSERKQLIDKVTTLKQNIERDEDMIRRVTDAMTKVTDLCADWKDLTPTEGDVKSLETTVNQLYADVVKWTAQLETATKNKAAQEQKVQEFITVNKQYDLEALMALNNYAHSEITKKTEELNTLKMELEKAKTLVENNVKLQSEHEAKKPDLTESDSVQAITEQLEQITQVQKEHFQRIGAIKQELEDNDKAKEQLKDLLANVERTKKEYERWDKMNRLLGDYEGSKFRRIAQSYVLAALIDAANSYMATLAPRYQLLVQAGSFVISIEDAYQGFAHRTVNTLSGGESFLVSLSLALALSDIGKQLSVDTLFIDEGFGTLSGEPLTNAINTLRTLQNRMGRHVGIISHVDELRERIPIQIKVEQEGNSSSSKISVVSL